MFLFFAHIPMIVVDWDCQVLRMACDLYGIPCPHIRAVAAVERILVDKFPCTNLFETNCVTPLHLVR